MIVLDTHVLVWALVDDARLGKRARRRIEQARGDDQAGVSAFSFWEIAMLAAAGRMKLMMTPEELRAVTLRTGVVEIPVSGDIAIMATRLHGMHGDPADRLIVATALVAAGTLITADRAILAVKGGPPRLDAQT